MSYSIFGTTPTSNLMSVAEAASKVMGLEEAVDLKKLKKEYDKNEDKNYHSENYLLLAKAFGTPAEVKKVEEILKRNKAQGSTSKADNDWMYKNINKYYDKIRNEEVVEGWKAGKYTIKDNKGKILGTYSSGGKAQKAMDDLMQKGDYDKLEVAMVEEVAEAKGTAYPATIDTLKMIVREKQNQTVMFKSGQAIVDLFTASAMVQVYDAMKPATKKKFEDMIKDKGGFMKTQAFAMKMMEDTRWNDRTLELDEAFFKVSIPDVAPTFVEADSASKVKANMRKILKPDVVKELEIERVTPAGMKKMYRDMAKGKEEIDEAVLIDRDYEYDGKVIKISKKNFSKVHRDFKGTTKGKETMLTYDDKEGTVLVPVQFTEDVEITEAVHDKKSTFTMAPFEDLRSVADAALQVMTRNKQEVKEEEVVKEEPPQKLTEEIV
jgi:hypothetical protein